MWHLRHEPRTWQRTALSAWCEGYRGVVEVVTGGGKTFFGLQCMAAVKAAYPGVRFLIVVPTIALLDQWRATLTSELGISEDEVTAIGGGAPRGSNKTFVIAVIDSVRGVTGEITRRGRWMLIVDECHHAASEANRRVLDGIYLATLGLSATPERQYDTWFTDYVVPALGPVIFRYTYEQARLDGVISDFDLWNVRVPLTDEEKAEIEATSQAISKELARLKSAGLEESSRLRTLLFARSRLSQSARSRISAAITLLDQRRGERGLVFHESITAAESIARGLLQRGHRVRLYHSSLGAPTRYENLRLYALGQIDILVTCRALDEGIDIPMTAFGVVAASTASHRQRIQRLGRVLRPAPGKAHATVITLYALKSEEGALEAEANKLDGVAEIRWFEARQP